MTDWVDCPICGGTDMRFEEEKDAPGYGYIQCLNYSCPSNRLAAAPSPPQADHVERVAQIGPVGELGVPYSLVLKLVKAADVAAQWITDAKAMAASEGAHDVLPIGPGNRRVGGRDIAPSKLGNKERAALRSAVRNIAKFVLSPPAEIARAGENNGLFDQTGAPGRVVVGADDPLYKAFRPKPDTIAAIEKNTQANAQAVVALRDMMMGHVTNWPDVKRFGTAVALIDKTLHAALSPPAVDKVERRDQLCLLIEAMCPDKDDHCGIAIGSQVEALADAILALSPPAVADPGEGK